MEQIYSSVFGPTALSTHKVRPTFIYGPAEKSAVLTVATLLARNVYHIGGTVAVPQKCRLGELMCVCLCRYYNSMCLTVREPINSVGDSCLCITSFLHLI